MRDINDASVMMRVDYHELSFLLTGDAERKVESKLVTRAGDELLDVDVLKAGHHGSKTSTTQALLDAVIPGAVVISVGEDNKFGHPAQEVLDRLSEMTVWRTDQDGAVEFSYVDEWWLVSSKR